jgi:hypothetical protein
VTEGRKKEVKNSKKIEVPVVQAGKVDIGVKGFGDKGFGSG